MRGHRLQRIPPMLRSPLYFLLALLLMAVLTPFMFRLGLITGIGFLISCCLACYRGALWRDGGVVVLIAIGYAITSFAFRLLWPAASESIRQQSFLAAILTMFFFFFIWWRMRRWKTGRR